MFAGPRRRRRGPPLVLLVPARPPVPAPTATSHVDRRPGRGGRVGTARPRPRRAPGAAPAAARPRRSWSAPGRHRALRLLFEVDGPHPNEPHWYLATLGTAPERQGQGIGSALLAVDARPHRRGGRARLPRVVEGAQRPASTPGSASRWSRSSVSATGGPPIWRMWREPRVPDPGTERRAGRRAGRDGRLSRRRARRRVGPRPPPRPGQEIEAGPGSGPRADPGCAGRRPTRRRGSPSMGTPRNRERRKEGMAVAGRMAGPYPSKVSEAIRRSPSISAAGRS